MSVQHKSRTLAPRTVVKQLRLPDEHVRYVPLDFEARGLCGALADAGLVDSLPTLFLWQGVTNYLTASAVDATLAEIRALGAPAAP